MNVFKKIKYELMILFLILLILVLGIVGFFIYGKVMEILSFDDVNKSSAATVEMNETLKNIEQQLTIQNCIAATDSSAAKQNCLN